MSEVILTEKHGNTGIILLNRPDALNALVLPMITGISRTLTEWENDRDIHAIVFKGVGTRAFCAGGDIKAAHRMGSAAKRGEDTMDDAHRLFGHEYLLNRQIFHYPKPLIAVMNGIVMGGGFGIAGPCHYRVVTEKSVFAMPEVGIGLFPDVGSTYYLNRCPGQAGTYLTVTGNSIGAADILYCGLGSHYIPLEHVPDDLLSSDLDRLSQTVPGESILHKHADIINSCFCFDTVEKIIEALRRQDDPWAKETLAVILTRSPLSMKISLAHLRWARGKSFDEVTAADFNLVQNVLEGDEFYEGVRALVIDKDKKPYWNPKTPEEVTKAMVDRYFRLRSLTLDNLEKN